MRNPTIVSALAMNALVMTVMMATLVAGPFHLARTLHLGPAATGLAMAAGPAVAALSGLPAGRLVDRSGAPRATLLALSFMASAALLLALAPAHLGAPGYVLPLALLTAGYALFQAAANTHAMASAAPEIRGFVSGLLTLSRNIGLIAGASAMGALFAAHGMRPTFLAAAALVLAALAIAAATARFASPAGGARASETLTKSPK
jgi:MFS family permease